MNAFTIAALASITITSFLGCAAPSGEDDEEGASRSTTQAVVTGPAFYVDGELYRTVGTPTDLPLSAPDHSFDIIWAFGGLQRNVAEAGPGQPGFNGGRWMVHALSFPNGYATAVARHDANGSGNLDSNEEVEAALAAGDAIDEGVRRVFVCPVIHVPKGG
jgi:hypothetical protein